MAGALAAVFVAGTVAFFAPCRAGVAMPGDLAAIGSVGECGSRASPSSMPQESRS